MTRLQEDVELSVSTQSDNLAVQLTVHEPTLAFPRTAQTLSDL